MTKIPDEEITCYPGFCMKYENRNMPKIADKAIVPAVAGLGGSFTAAVSNMQNMPVWGSAGLFIAGGVITLAASYVFSWDMAVKAHAVANRVLTHKNADLEKGGKIARAAQVAGFSAPVIMSLGINAAVASLGASIHESESEKDTYQSLNQTTSLVDAVYPLEDTNEHVSNPAEYQPVSHGDLITMNV